MDTSSVREEEPGPETPPSQIPPDPPLHGPEVVEALPEKFAEISEYLSFYLETQLERLKISAREVLLGVALLPVMLSLIAGAILISLGFLFYGMASGLTQALEMESWAAFMVTGGIFLIPLGAGLYYLLVGIKKKALRKREKEYESKIQAQRSRFGRSMADQAQE